MEEETNPISNVEDRHDEECAPVQPESDSLSPSDAPQGEEQEQPAAPEGTPSAEPEPAEPTPIAAEADPPKGRRNIIASISSLFKSTSQLLRTVIILAVVLLVAFGIFSLQHRAKHKKVVRTITQTVVEVKKIKEFCTANYQEETVVVARRKKLLRTEELAIIAKGTVRVGFDLSKMTTRLTSDTSIVVELPAPIVLDVITNPGDFDIFEENGKWDQKVVTTYKNLARATILNHAKAEGIMEDAEKNGVEKLTLLFKRMGMKSVTINVAHPEPPRTESGTPFEGGMLTMPEKQDPAI